MTTLLAFALGLLLQSTALLLLGLLALRLAQKRGPTAQTLIGRSTLAGVALLLLLSPLTGHLRIQPVWRVTLLEPTPKQVSTLPKQQGEQSEEGGAPLAAPGLVLRNISPSPSSRGGTESAAIDQGAAINLGTADAQSAASGTPKVSVLPPSGGGAGGGLRSTELGSALYAAVTVALLLWLSICQWHLTRLRRTATPLIAGPAADLLAELSAQPPQVLTHSAVRSPFLAGLVRPAIFLPPTYATDFSPDALRAILAHELAHLARRDNAWTLASRLLCALLWPQLLLWLLCQRLEQAAEDACDAAVLVQCPPRTYADCLLTLAERHPLSRRQRVLGAGVAPYRSSLGRRVQRILTQGNHTMSPISTKLRLTIAALTLAAVIGGVCLVSSAPAQVSKPLPPHSKKPTLVGIWAVKNLPSDTHDSIVIFGSQGDAALVEVPGTKCTYGHYFTDGSVYTVTETRIENQGHMVSADAHLYPFSVIYSILGNTLTAHPKNVPIPLWTARRISDYPEGIAIEAVAAQQAALLGAKPPRASQSTFDEAQFLAGLTAVQGPGVVVTLNNSKKSFPSRLPAAMQPPNLIHDSDINQVVNELKAAGAEAIAVNDQRLVATSSVRTAGSLIFVNNVSQMPPYVIKAIGNSEMLSAAINLPGGIASQIKSYDPGMFSTANAQILTLSAYSGVGTPLYAKPLTSDQPQKTEAQPKPHDALTPLKVRRQALQSQMAKDQAAAKQAALKFQATLARLKEDGFSVQATPDGMIQSVSIRKWIGLVQAPTLAKTDQDKITDQEIAIQVAKIAHLEASGDTPNHPDVIAAKVNLRTLEGTHREARINAKPNFVKDVQEYSGRQGAEYNKFADIANRWATAHHQTLKDQSAIAPLTTQIQTVN